MYLNIVVEFGSHLLGVACLAHFIALVVLLLPCVPILVLFFICQLWLSGEITELRQAGEGVRNPGRHDAVSTSYLRNQALELVAHEFVRTLVCAEKRTVRCMDAPSYCGFVFAALQMSIRRRRRSRRVIEPHMPQQRNELPVVRAFQSDGSLQEVVRELRWNFRRGDLLEQRAQVLIAGQV